MAKPLFNTALGAAALTSQSKPPARFEGVTARVFPLRTNMQRLRSFCDAYLGVAPDLVEFRPSVPYVLLMVLDYGKMAVEFANMGWVSQREVAFAVPLEWYDKRDGTRFVDYASVCPFIYVDDETSLSTGRAVFGWPKARVWASREVNPWVYHPLNSQCLLTLSTMVHPELYAGERQEPRTLLEVLKEDRSYFSRFPFDASRRANPLSMFPEALQGYMSLVGSMVETIFRPPLLGHGEGQSLDAFASLMRMTARGLGSVWRNPVANNITLKQFQDSYEPDYLCYQALVNSRMVTERFNAGGMLGDLNMLMGDPSGGFRIVIHSYAAQPIVDALGIEVSERMRVGDAEADVIRPVFPFWVDVDLHYGVDTEVLCWRTKESPWHVDDGDTPRLEAERAHPTGKHRFNTTLGGALQGVAGPFDFPDVTLRALPLLADPERLASFCSAYLDNQHVRFEPWGRCVYLVATSYEEMSSKTNDIGWWADRELTFFVPVKQRNAKGELISVGIVPAFPFVNSTTAAISSDEVQGQPTVRAVLESPRDEWMFESGPSEEKEQAYLTCMVDALPALYLGQQSEKRVLLEVKAGDALPYDKQRIASDWGLDLLAEHRRLVELKKQAGLAFDVAKALSLEVLAHEQPINHFSLKQFRDAEDPDRACYQSLVRTPRMIDSISDLQEMDELVHVHITELATQPIVELLGLVAKWSHVTPHGKVDVLQPMRPFWMKAVLRENLTEKLCWRAGSETWERTLERYPGERTDGYFESEERTRVGLGVLEGLGTRPSHYAAPMKRQHLKTTALEFLRDEPEESRITREEARDAVEKIEPHMVIGAILSAEWEHWGSPRWFERGVDGLDIAVKPDLCVRTDSLGEQERIAVEEGTSRFFQGGWISTDGLLYSTEEKAGEEQRGPALKSLRES